MVKLSRSRESHPHHNIHQDIDDHSVDCYLCTLNQLFIETSQDDLLWLWIKLCDVEYNIRFREDDILKMWCCLPLSPCCCGPCQMRITTGAKIVFTVNTISLMLLLIATVFIFDDVTPQIIFTGGRQQKYFISRYKENISVLFCVMISVNVAGLAGLRKNGSFLPVPDTWRHKMKLRDKYQFCFLIPWILVYGLITVIWSVVFLPATVIIGSMYAA